VSEIRPTMTALDEPLRGPLIEALARLLLTDIERHPILSPDETDEPRGADSETARTD
jgi:hypothetical protein